MAGATRAKTYKNRMKWVLFWGQDGKCFYCSKDLPHPADQSSPLRQVVVEEIQREDGSRGDGSRTGSLVCHMMCAAQPRYDRLRYLEILREVRSKILKFKGWSWAETEGFLRGESCFLRFGLAAELPETENSDADHERTASGSAVSSEP